MEINQHKMFALQPIHHYKIAPDVAFLRYFILLYFLRRTLKASVPHRPRGATPHIFTPVCSPSRCLPPSISPFFLSQDQSEINSTVIRSPTNTVVIRGLKPGSIYVFQVRARTVAGFGRYSGKLYFQTMTEGENSAGVGAGTQRSNHLPLGVGWGSGGGRGQGGGWSPSHPAAQRGHGQLPPRRSKQAK